MGKGKNLEENMAEFIMSNFKENGYTDAKYRISSKTISLEGLEVPEKIEVLQANGSWERFPSVHIQYQNYEENTGRVIVFLENGKYTSVNYDSKGLELYEKAVSSGLTVGNLGVYPMSIIRKD